MAASWRQSFTAHTPTDVANDAVWRQTWRMVRCTGTFLKIVPMIIPKSADFANKNG
jgi:hypothetical protein